MAPVNDVHQLFCVLECDCRVDKKTPMGAVRSYINNNIISGIGSGAVSVLETLDLPMAAGNIGKAAGRRNYGLSR